MVKVELDKLNVPHVVFNQRRFADLEIDLEINNGYVNGWFRENGRAWRLEAFQGLFLRLMDDRHLPELEDDPDASDLRATCRNLHETLMRWCSVTDARVVNRLSPMASNGSKTYQAQLISDLGFHVPETLVTNDPEAAEEFWQSHERVVYKSVSGVRSIVQTMTEADLARLDKIRWCPTQFQVYVEGTDLRVHVVKSAVFATRICSEATDYRYAHEQTETLPSLEPHDPSTDLADACVRLADGLGLVFAGIDLRVSPDGRVTCFEVNPCPAFSYYESQTRQPIARAVARYLAGMS
jgi:glutathione synthase/RimK-type ligase-like ATP-grasp enzyme